MCVPNLIVSQKMQQTPPVPLLDQSSDPKSHLRRSGLELPDSQWNPFQMMPRFEACPSQKGSDSPGRELAPHHRGEPAPALHPSHAETLS